MACGILVPQPGMEAAPPALEAQRLNHWTAREVPDRVLGEVEKDSFIALPGKAIHTGRLPQKTMCPNPGGFDVGFMTMVQRWGL